MARTAFKIYEIIVAPRYRRSRSALIKQLTGVALEQYISYHRKMMNKHGKLLVSYCELQPPEGGGFNSRLQSRLNAKAF